MTGVDVRSSALAGYEAPTMNSFGQIYPLDTESLQEPVAAQHVKLRRLCRVGTQPGLHLVYVELDPLTWERDLNVPFTYAGTSKKPRPRGWVWPCSATSDHDRLVMDLIVLDENLGEPAAAVRQPAHDRRAIHPRVDAGARRRPT